MPWSRVGLAGGKGTRGSGPRPATSGPREGSSGRVGETPCPQHAGPERRPERGKDARVRGMALGSDRPALDTFAGCPWEAR